MSRIWPFGSSGSAGLRTPDEPETLQERVFPSRALQDLLTYLPQGGGWRVLDLGAASNRNLAFFSPFRAHYTVEDLLGTLQPCRRSDGFDVECVRRLPGLLDFEEEATFDLVIAWDLLNYLSLDVVALLTDRLAPHARSGCLLYALIWRQPEMPPRPCRCEIIDGVRIRQIFPEGGMAPDSPRYTDSVLAEALAPFRVEKAYLLKHGMQEYVFEVEDDRSRSDRFSDPAGTESRS